MTIADRMAHYKVPGVSVAFFDHGQIIWTKTYGFADVASKKPVTPDTLFQAASISNLRSLAALRLVQDGKLSLDEDVNVKLRTWKVPENNFTVKEKVTVRHPQPQRRPHGSRFRLRVRRTRSYRRAGPQRRKASQL